MDNNKLFVNIWFKKPKLISNDDLNQINLIIENLKIKQESPNKYNYIENIDPNTSFYITIELLNDEEYLDNNIIIIEECNLNYIINNDQIKNNNNKIKSENNIFIENKKGNNRNDNKESYKNKENKKVEKKVINYEKNEKDCKQKNVNKNNDNKGNPENNRKINSINILENRYINQQFYPIVRNRSNINPNNLRIENVIGDGNCLFRSLSRFIFESEDLYPLFMREMYEEVVRRRNNYPDITLGNEIGPLHINVYIDHFQNDQFYGGELEISIASSLYNIKIATLEDLRTNEDIPIGYSFINYYNNDNSEDRHLMILLNQNNIHF